MVSITSCAPSANALPLAKIVAPELNSVVYVASSAAVRSRR